MSKLFNNIEFEHIISLGHNCNIANSLIDINARGTSFPFDWTLTTIDYIIQCFDTKFENFFNIDLMDESPKGQQNCANYKNLIYFVHAGQYQYLKNDSNFYKSRKDQYERRIKRLYEKLNSKTNILFVVDNHYSTFENLSKLIYKLNECKFKANIKLLVFSGGDKNLLKLNDEFSDFCYVDDFYKVNRWMTGNFILHNINYKIYSTLKKSKDTYID